MSEENAAQREVSESDVAQREPVRRGVITAFLIGGAALIGLSMFAQYNRMKPPVSVPALTLVAGDSVIGQYNPVVRFVASGLMLHKDGWMAGSLHPHLRVGDVTHMAGPADITRLAGDTFAWKLPIAPAGSYRLNLFWADMSHVASGDSSSAIIYIRP